MRRATSSTRSCRTLFASGSRSARVKPVAPVASAALLVVLLVGGAACRGANAPPAVDGEQAYAVRCSYCHDLPNGIGVELGARVLASYTTVGGLGRYIRATMPHEAPGSLSAAEYDAILAYLVESRDLVPRTTGDGSGRPAPWPDAMTPWPDAMTPWPDAATRWSDAMMPWRDSTGPPDSTTPWSDSTRLRARQ